jgi:hypothetical protein
VGPGLSEGDRRRLERGWEQAAEKMAAERRRVAKIEAREARNREQQEQEDQHVRGVQRVSVAAGEFKELASLLARPGPTLLLPLRRQLDRLCRVLHSAYVVVNVTGRRNTAALR